MKPPMSAAYVRDGLPMPRRLIAAIAISLGTALTIIDGSIVTVALPTIARDLHVDGSAAVLVVTVYQLLLVMTLLPCSALGDRIGLRRMYQYGQLLFTVSTALCFFAHSLPFLLVIRAMQAVGAAAVLSMMSALIRSTYPAKMLGRGLGVNAVVATVSASAAPSLGGLILSVAPWPWLFAAAVPFAILSLILGRAALPDVPRVPGRFDLGGAMLNMATFGLLIGGLESAVHGDSPVVSAAIIVAGSLFAIWFVRHEKAEALPILPVDLLADRAIVLSVVGGLLVYMSGMLLTLSMPFRLEQIYGFQPSEVGAILTPFPVAMMIAAPLGGMISDRIHPGWLGAIGMVLSTIALLLLAFPPASPQYIDFAWRMGMCGFGVALFMSPNARLIISSTPHHRAAAGGGLISTARLVGQTFGATLLAALLALGIGTSRAPALIATACTVIAGILSIARLGKSAPRRKVTFEELSEDAV